MKVTRNLDSFSIQGTLVETLHEEKPTYFLGVPRIWEKFQEKIPPALKVSPFVRKEAPICKKFREAFGLGFATKLFTAAAPIMKETLEIFNSLDMPLLEIFGMSECSGKL